MSQSSILKYVRPKDAGEGDATLDSTYRVTVEPSVMERHVRALTMTPSAASGGFGAPPESFDAYSVDATGATMRVPRFYGIRHFGMATHDRRTLGEPLADGARFASTLDASQRRAFDATLEALARPGNGAILVRKPGGGKTVLSLAIVHQLGVRTIVFSHKTDLLDQWQERIAQHLPGVRVGRIQQNRVDVEADVVLATLQSVAMRAYDPAVFAKFGLAVFDEAHHMGARHFFSVLGKICPKYLLGLTATPIRKDGLTCLLEYGIGPVACEDDGEGMQRVDVTCVQYTSGSQNVAMVRGMPCIPLMLNSVVKDLRRTRLVAQYVRQLFVDGRHLIVLSHQIDHLHDICHELVHAEVPVPEDAIGFYVGRTPRRQREQVVTRRVILATYAMAKEGLDIRTLDAEVLATPLGDVEQAVGRIQRPCENKRTPVLIDIVDPYSSFLHQSRKRRRFYESKGFEVTDR